MDNMSVLGNLQIENVCGGEMLTNTHIVNAWLLLTTPTCAGERVLLFAPSQEYLQIMHTFPKVNFKNL